MRPLAADDANAIRPTPEQGAPAMHDQAVRDALSAIAVNAVPDSTDLLPGIDRALAGQTRPAPRRLARRRVGLAAAATIVVVLGLALGRPLLPGQSDTAQAAEIARQDPEVAAILRGDIAIVTVTSIVDQVATVVVQDSQGRQVTLTVDLRSRIATVVYQGPQLSAALTAQALALIRTDPRTSSLLARGAAIGRITPILVTATLAAPPSGSASEVSETWAQVPLDLGGQEWVARVDLPQNRIDQIVDPQGNEIPMP